MRPIVDVICLGARAILISPYRLQIDGAASMGDWIDQNTFISDDGKVVRNGFYRDREGGGFKGLGPK